MKPVIIIAITVVLFVSLLSIPAYSELASFVDETKNPQSYIDRYNNEPTYKKWFNDNYPEYSSIYEAVGLPEPIPEWVRSVFIFWSNGNISDAELTSAMVFLIDGGIIKVPLIQELQKEIIELKTENSELYSQLNTPTEPEPTEPKQCDSGTYYDEELNSCVSDKQASSVSVKASYDEIQDQISILFSFATENGDSIEVSGSFTISILRVLETNNENIFSKKYTFSEDDFITYTNNYGLKLDKYRLDIDEYLPRGDYIILVSDLELSDRSFWNPLEESLSSYEQRE